MYDGSTWVGLIPFRLVGAHFGTGPALPYVGTFPETNVRFYSVDGEGRHGVVFGSLDAARLPFVLGARAALGLNYTWSRMRVERSGSGDPLHQPAPLAGPAGSPEPTSGCRSPRRWWTTRSPTSSPPAGACTPGTWAGRSSCRTPTPAGRCSGPGWSACDDELLAAAGFPDLAERAPDSVLYSAGVRTRFGAPQPVRGAPPVATMPG